MTDNINNSINADEESGGSAEANNSGGTADGLNESSDYEKELKKTQDELSEAQAKYDELYDKYLRVSAEYDNYRKRTAKEKANVYFDATVDVLGAILPVIDNIERAVQFAETDNAGGAEKITEGLKMVYSQFTKSFEKLGISEIQANGEKFNPEFHNAVSHEEDSSQPENTIVAVLQKGYIKGEKVIRPAMVKVVN